MKIDQVLKGRLKWYEKSTKRKVNYKRSLRLGALKWNYYNLHSGNFLIVTLWIRNRVDAKYGYIYIYIFPFDVTRSSPVLYHEYCIQDGNLLPTFSLLLLTLLLPIFTTHALLPIFLEEPWVLEWIWIRADTQIRFENGYLWAWKFLNQERNSCGFKNTRICVEGAWMNDWMVCHQVSRFWVVFKQMTKLHKEPIRLRYINAKCTNDTYVKTLPKRMAVAIFRDTRQRTVFSKTTKVLCLVSCVLC